ncbi:glycosyltransferase family 2 protein [Zhongshania sp.]|uniref:glycosyltransferase family 2 protein n=1 Tax=Zhongshania sp. TaxID=1971902 RepID=UPI0035619621
MRNLRTEREITSRWGPVSENPAVSICCIAYNHESYIEDAFEGFLIQETNFPFEIIVHDDASTDKTADIIREYADAYPNIIKPIIQKINQYSISQSQPIINAVRVSRGKYVAVCEADDYWLDPNKIQIQHDYLEKNPSIVISGHDAKIVNEKNEVVSKSKLHDSMKKDFSPEDLVTGKCSVLTLNWFHRNIDVYSLPEQRHVLNMDNFVLSLLGHHGGSHYHSDIASSAYRVHSGGVWSGVSNNRKNEAQINTFFWMYQYYSRVNMKSQARCYWQKYLRVVFLQISYSDLVIEVFRKVFRSPYSKIRRLVAGH